MIMMSELYQNGTSRGHLIVLDLAGLTFTHLTKVGPFVVKRFLDYVQEAMPLRHKGLHFINTPHIGRLLSLIKPFLSRELSKTIRVHNSVEDLVKVIPRECLPREYGGSAGAVSALHSKMKSDLVENGPLFEWERQQRVDEKRRPANR